MELLRSNIVFFQICFKSQLKSLERYFIYFFHHVLVEVANYLVELIDLLLELHKLLLEVRKLRNTFYIKIFEVLILSKPGEVPPNALPISQIHFLVQVFIDLLDIFLIALQLFIEFVLCSQHLFNIVLDVFAERIIPVLQSLKSLLNLLLSRSLLNFCIKIVVNDVEPLSEFLDT